MENKICSHTLIEILQELERQGKDAYTHDELDCMFEDIWDQVQAQIERKELQPESMSIN